MPGPYPSPFWSSHTPRRLVLGYDASNGPSLALAITTCLRGWSRWSRNVPAFLPASAIDGQPLRRGRCISPFTGGWELAQNRTQRRNSSYQRLLLVDHPPIVSVSTERVAHLRPRYVQNRTQGKNPCVLFCTYLGLRSKCLSHQFKCKHALSITHYSAKSQPYLN
jgi:hypothetical protein